MSHDEDFTNLIQRESFELLKFFHNICAKEDLLYILDFGTLLGAVRHSDFIPWDDDLDVSMPREDYDKFLSVVEEYLPSNIVLQNNKTEKNFFSHFSKLRKTDIDVQEFSFSNYKVSKGVWLDIFPYDPVCANIDDERERVLKINKVLLFKRFAFPIVYEKDKNFRNLPKLIIKKCWIAVLSFTQIINKSLILGYFQKQINEHENILSQCNEYDFETMRLYVSPIPLGVDKKIMNPTLKKSDFEDRILAKFSTGYFYIPKRYKTILKERYGDYNQLPPESERKNTHIWLLK